MNFLSSLDAKDRKLLLWCVGIVFVLTVALAILSPNNADNDDPLPSSYRAGQHGARAAYETLLRSGYSIERWERPLDELAAEAGPQTVVILAQPAFAEPEQIKAIRKILRRGGRVLAIGFAGGNLLPGESVDTAKGLNIAACKLEPEGLDTLAGTGEVWMKPNASWGAANPAARVEYSCAGNPAVVEYDWGKGHIVWWAGSTPLENGSLSRAANLDLLLNSLGPRDGHRFYWDESLHGEERSVFSYVHGPSWALLWFGLLGMAILIVFSFSRRSGPLRDLPPPTRATPIEFLEALGGLYRNAGAASTAISIALERFRRRCLRLCGQRPSKMDAAELAAIVRRRFPQIDASLEADLQACEEAAWSQTAAPKDALKLIQTLHGHSIKLDDAARPGSTFTRPTAQSEKIQSNEQERSL